MSVDDLVRVSSSAPPGGLEVYLLGLTDFGAMLGLQELSLYELGEREQADGRLFLCEHPPTVSIGRSGSRAELVGEEEAWRREGIEVHWVSRGGGAVVHGPGQLAVYLQLPLRRLGIGLSAYRNRIESSAVQVCRELKIPVKRAEDQPGLWTRGGRLAAYGVGIKSWISCQGLFLNVSLSPTLLAMATAGSDGAAVVSMQSLRLAPVRMARVRELLIDQLSRAFGYDKVDVMTGHPRLQRVSQRVSVHA